MSIALVNQDYVIPILKKQLETELNELLKPIVAEATKKAEQEIQKALGRICIGLLDTQFSVERFGTDLRILVKYEKG